MKGRIMSTKKRTVTAAGVVIAALAFASPALADVPLIYGFTGIVTDESTPADLAAIAVLEAQMFVEVAEVPGANQVQFTFLNIDAGSEAEPSIARVYFDDGALVKMARIIDADDGVGGDPDVDFSQGASPGELPAGNELVPPFETTADFLADADPSTYWNGVGEGQSLTVVFDLKGVDDEPDEVQKTFADVINDMSSGELRIGIHVQAFEDDNSNGGVGNPNPVPTPSAAALGGLGFAMLSAVGWVKKRRASRSVA